MGRWRAWLVGICCGIFSIFLSSNVSAAIKSNDDLYKLSILQGVRKCYELYLKDEIEVQDLNNNYENIFDNYNSFSKTSSDDVWITTHIGNDLNTANYLNDSNLSCKQVFEGYSSGKQQAKGLSNYYQIPNTLDGLGYVFLENRVSNSDSSGTVDADTEIVKYSVASIGGGEGGNDDNKNQMTSEGEITCEFEQVEKSGKFYWKPQSCRGEIIVTYREGGSTEEWKISIDEGGWFIFEGDFTGNAYMAADFMEALDDYDGDKESNKVALKDVLGSKVSLTKVLIGNLEGIANRKYSYPSVELRYEIIAPDVNNDEDMHAVYVPLFNNKMSAAARMLYGLGVDEKYARNIDDNYRTVYYKWDNEWTYSLYYKYLRMTMQVYPNDISLTNCSDKKPESGYVFRNSSTTWCNINILPQNKEAILSTTFSIPDFGLGLGLVMKQGTFNDVLEWFNNEQNYDGIPEDSYANGSVDEYGELTPSGGVNGDNPEKEVNVCYEKSGTLGWIICPIIEAATGIGERMWNQIETNHLQMPAQEIFGKDSGVEGAWNMMRNIANTLFIILFLFVIFSQLTGVGIDNYGIKKILPKLIIVAVLVNLSYIICELAIDLSNIFGNGLNDMLSNMAKEVPAGIFEAEMSGGKQVTGWIAVIGLSGGGLLLFQWLSTGSFMGAIAGIGLLVLGVVVTVVVAMLTLYLILIAREAGIILLVVLSPVAMVCYLLPNTEKMYKKWFDLFKALLVVYPVCGAMIGAGKMAGSVLASTSNESMNVAAMIVQVLPFFFIPMLLKSSLSLMGNIGTKISSLGRGLGQRASRGATGAIRNTEKYKNYAQRQKDWADYKKAGRIREKTAGRLAKLASKDTSTMSEWERKKYERQRRNLIMKNDAAARAALAYEDKEKRAENMAENKGYEAMKIAQGKKADADAIANEEMVVMDGTNNGSNFDSLMNMYEQAAREGNVNRMRAVVKVAGQRKDFAERFAAKFSDNNYSYGASRLNANGNSKLANSVAKEIATGGSAGTYKAASPLKYMFASQINENAVNGNSNYDYSIDPAALKAFVAKGSDLVSMSGSEMTALSNWINEVEAETIAGGVTPQMRAEAARIRTLANTVYDNRNESRSDYDTTKDAEIRALAGVGGGAPTPGTPAPGGPAPAPGPGPAPTPGTPTPGTPTDGGDVAGEGEKFDVHTQDLLRRIEQATPSLRNRDTTGRNSNANNHGTTESERQLREALYGSNSAKDPNRGT